MKGASFIARLLTQTSFGCAALRRWNHVAYSLTNSLARVGQGACGVCVQLALVQLMSAVGWQLPLPAYEKDCFSGGYFS